MTTTTDSEDDSQNDCDDGGQSVTAGDENGGPNVDSEGNFGYEYDDSKALTEYTDTIVDTIADRVSRQLYA